jgi:hypothetical protein
VFSRPALSPGERVSRSSGFTSRSATGEGSLPHPYVSGNRVVRTPKARPRAVNRMFPLKVGSTSLASILRR